MKEIECTQTSFIFLYSIMNYYDWFIKNIQTSQPKADFCLKTVDTFGNCQRLVFIVGVSQHMQKITNL